jgi:archaellin
MKTSLLLLFLPACASCGFAPMHSALPAEARDIYIAPIVGTNGIDLRNHLIVAWNTANSGTEKYSLAVRLNEPRTIYKGLQRTGDATWEEVRMTASWTLSRGSETIAKSRETASESYTFVSDLVAANASKAAAVKNATMSVGDSIEQKVNAMLVSDFRGAI